MDRALSITDLYPLQAPPNNYKKYVKVIMPSGEFFKVIINPFSFKVQDINASLVCRNLSDGLHQARDNLIPKIVSGTFNYYVTSLLSIISVSPLWYI